MDIKIKKVTVVLSFSADKILINVDLPSSMPKVCDEVIMEMTAEYDFGAQYVREVFGVEPQVVNTRH